MSDGSRDGPSLLLVGYDGSSGSGNALAYATGVARREKCELAIAEVKPPGHHELLTISSKPAHRPRVDFDSGSVTTEVACDLKKWLPGRWWLETCEGDPAVELERLSNELRSDAIIIGRAKGSVQQPLGSVAAWLIRYALQPVIVVP